MEESETIAALTQTNPEHGCQWTAAVTEARETGDLPSGREICFSCEAVGLPSKLPSPLQRVRASFLRTHLT